MSNSSSISAKPRRSRFYQDVACFLEHNLGFKGTYGELAAAVGRCPRRNGPATGQVVRCYANNVPNFDDTRVYRKDTKRPGYLNS